MTLKLLIAEDARSVAHVVAFGARMTWPDCQVVIAEDGAQALLSFEQEQPDLVVLDIEMPPPDGFAVCRHIRERSQVPIMMLTVRDATVDKIRALDLGADDYLTKPFDHLELLARLRALMRRTARPLDAAGADIQSYAFSLDSSRHEVRVKGQTVALTSKEYRLLEELARHAGNVLPYNYLLERVWGSEYLGEDHYLKVFVRRLRNKLGDDTKNPNYIQTEWGIGYRFVLPH